MKPGLKILMVTMLTVILLPATGARGITDGHWLWLDDENTYQCDDPFTEAGFQCQLTATTDEDCDGGGSCDWGWSEGVIYMHPVRLEVDLSVLAAVDSVEVYYWDATAGDMRSFLYQDDTLVAQVQGDWYQEMITLRTAGAAVNRLAVSACDGELYEIAIYEGDGLTRVPVSSLVRLQKPTPNPFNPRTTLGFYLAHPGPASLAVFDLTGRRLRTILQDVDLPAGLHRYSWNGRDRYDRPVAAGTYLYRVEADKISVTGKMTLAP